MDEPRNERVFAFVLQARSDLQKLKDEAEAQRLGGLARLLDIALTETKILGIQSGPDSEMRSLLRI